MTIIIGLTGFAGSGKDTVAARLVEQFGAARVAFADQLKDEIVEAFGVDRQLFEDPALKDRPTPELQLRYCTEAGYCDHQWGVANAYGHRPLVDLDEINPRTIMTTWGDWRRDSDPAYFVRAGLERINALAASGAHTVAVPDVRYHNERHALKGRGAAIWRVSRPGLQPRGGHSSEWALAGTPVDANIVNGGSVEQLDKIVADLYLALRDRKAA
ncbi:MAG TPA: hypothetical protein PK177_13940 [Burkholderiaceae bacterium]|nr:hypothetical protein [Burkholderiaceae bacterium]